MKIYKDIPQGSPEWFEIRNRKMTASHAQAIGNSGKGLESYIIDKMAAVYSCAETESISNKDTERGIELEQYSREMYELETGLAVEQVAFIEMDEYTGCSPDGLVGEDGGVEIKCLNDTNHFRLILGGEIDSKYMWQIQMSLLVTGRTWWDYVSYNPNYKQSLIIRRITKDEAYHNSLGIGISNGKKMIDAIIKKLI
jgi:hypothetical protein